MCKPVRPFQGGTLARLVLALAVAILLPAAPARAQVCNVKVVTDASPDYADMESLIHSTTSRWPTAKEKCWALFYWNHINRRQMSPMWLHGCEVTDPIMQWNDYGFTMCSTICGINCSTWGAMGLPVRHWEIQLHTVPEVFYDGRWHMYDNSMSALYTLCDGVTIAGVEDIGKTQACAASGGKAEFAHIANYHCLNGTGTKGFLTGADCNRELHQEGICFNPNKIRNQNDLWWDRGHRFILNLRPGEVYTRYYHRLGEGTEHYVPNEHSRMGGDPDHRVARIRGNGVRTWMPDLQNLTKSAYSMRGVEAAANNGAVEVRPLKADDRGSVVFMVEGANVITSLGIKARVFRRSAADGVRISIAEPSPRRYGDLWTGERWSQVWEAEATGEQAAQANVVGRVNGSYAVLVRVDLTGSANAADAALRSIEFDTVTQVNSKALPRLNIGRNTIYVGAGDQSEAIQFWPDLRGDDYRDHVVAEQNVATEKEHPQVAAVCHPKEAGKEGFLVFRQDAPRDITRVVYGGRLFNKGEGSKVTFQHSFDNGKSWVLDYTLEGNTPPWDVIQYVTVNEVPAGTRAVLYKYAFSSNSDEPKAVGLYNVRMETDYRPADPGFKPMEVTWTWNERQEDYSVVQRSHTQLVEKVPFTYTVDVAGSDHPTMEALRVNLKGAAGEQKYGYSDGRDAGGTRYVPTWASYGTNFAEGKPYTTSVPSATNWDAGDKAGERKLTDGVAGSGYGGGSAYSYGLLWQAPKNVLITVDLEKARRCGAFRVHAHGYPWFDAMRGQFPEQIEVFTSSDNREFTSRGSFTLKLRWKDLPASFMWPDTERFEGHTFDLLLPRPVDARYVQFRVSSTRMVGITEVAALDWIKHEPFDLRIALPKDAPPVGQ